MSKKTGKTDRTKNIANLTQSDIENLKRMLWASDGSDKQQWGFRRCAESDANTELDNSMKRLCDAGYVRMAQIRPASLANLYKTVQPNRRFYAATPAGMRAIGFDEATIKDCMAQNPGF